MALTKSYCQVFDPHGKTITSAITLLYIYTPKLEPLKNSNFVIYHNDKMIFFNQNGALLKNIIPEKSNYLTSENIIALEDSRMLFLWHEPLYHQETFNFIGRQLKRKYLSNDGEVLGEDFVIYYGNNLICKASAVNLGNIGIMCRGSGRSSDTSQEILPQNFKQDFRCFGVFSTTNPSALTTWTLLPDSEIFDQFSLTSIGDGKYVITDEHPEKYAYASIIDTYHGNLIIKL